MDRIIKSEEDWSEEHDHLPLKQRLKILRASNQQITDLVIPLVDAVVKKEDQDCVSEDVDSAPFLVEGRVESFPLEECHNGRTRECCIPKIEQDTGCSSNHIITSEQDKVGCDNLISSTVNCLNYCCSAEDKAINAKSEIPAYILDDLDHVDLKERRRMLLSRKLLDSRNPVCKDTIIGLATTVVGCLHDAVTGKEDSYSVIEKYPTKGDSSKVSWERTAVVCEDLNFESSNSIVAGSASTKPLSPTSVHQSRGTTTSSECIMDAHKNDICSSKVTSIEHELCGRKNDLYGKHNTALNSPLTTSVNVKVEPIENNELDNNILENSLMTNLVTVKSEPTIPDAFSEDVIDHMLLSARMKLLTPREIAKADIHSEGSRKIVLSSVHCQPISSKSDPPAKIKRSRKRKKTATDSVETALEEDVPGLLQVLVDKGVLIDEMKLYGQTEIDEAIDESLTEFSELEAVISKLFSQRSLLKLAPLKGTKGEKTSYCLACLISLVEQARYLQFRKWPVEWGWCRDLQSFIFVFERHNRIVLERPEYGYATYFFELVDSLTIDWQIKRLVTTMKLTSCSRIALIENKALTVGEDLTESEAGVLSDYGWIPDTGLGTMLNYRDRVVHDRKNETDSSEWRSKIGNLLMDGFNGGTVISTSVPKKFVDNSVVQNLPIKLEI